MKSVKVLSTASAVLLIPSIASGIEITDYNVPSSVFQEAYIEGQGSTRNGNQNRTSYDYSTSANYLFNSTSLDRNFNASIEGSADGERDGAGEEAEIRNRSGQASLRYDEYFSTSDKWFWFSGIDANYKHGSDSTLTKLNTGVGYGRVINATPLAKAIRVVEELQEHGQMKADVTDACYLNVAQVISRQNEFETQFGADEYEASWFEAMEKSFAECGALEGDTLSAVAALHMRRVLIDEPISIRKYGYFVRAGVGYLYTDFDGYVQDPSLDLELEYAHPIGLQSQITDVLKVSFVSPGEDDGYIASNDLRYTYEISDSIDWETSYNVVYTKINNEATEEETKTLNQVVNTSFRLYLTNRLNLNAGVTATQNEDYVENNGNDNFDVATTVGFRYRLR